MVLDFESIHYVVQHGQQKVKGKSVHKPFALPWMGCKSIARLAPTFHQTSLIICQDPFKLLGGERETFAQEHLFYTHLIPFVMLYLPCHLEEQHHPTCHLHISLLVWKVYTSYIQVYLKK